MAPKSYTNLCILCKAKQASHAYAKPEQALQLTPNNWMFNEAYTTCICTFREVEGSMKLIPFPRLQGYFTSQPIPVQAKADDVQSWKLGEQKKNRSLATPQQQRCVLISRQMPSRGCRRSPLAKAIRLHGQNQKVDNYFLEKETNAVFFPMFFLSSTFQEDLREKQKWTNYDLWDYLWQCAFIGNCAWA